MSTASTSRIALVRTWKATVFFSLSITAIMGLSDLDAQSSVREGLSFSRVSVEPPSFEVASIRPSRAESPTFQVWRENGYRVQNEPILSTLSLAYFPPYYLLAKWRDALIHNAPDWTRTENYDIHAKMSYDHVPRWQREGVNGALRKLLLQRLLEERCRLIVHTVPTVIEAYGLRLSAHQQQMTLNTTKDIVPSDGVRLSGGEGYVVPITPGASPRLRFFRTSMKDFADYLSQSAERIVIDQTGADGTYDFSLLRLPAEEATSNSSPWDLRGSGFILGRFQD